MLLSHGDGNGREAARVRRRKVREESERTPVLLTKSGLAQWPFRAVETLPIIRSFICWVASGLSLQKQKNKVLLLTIDCLSFPPKEPREKEINV